MSKPWSPILAEHRLYHTHPCVGTGVVRCSDNTCCRLQEPLCQTLKKRQYKSDKSLPYLLISKYLLSPGYFQRSMWQTAIMSTCSLITPFGDIFKDGLYSIWISTFTSYQWVREGWLDIYLFPFPLLPSHLCLAKFDLTVQNDVESWNLAKLSTIILSKKWSRHFLISYAFFEILPNLSKIWPFFQNFDQIFDKFGKISKNT